MIGLGVLGAFVLFGVAPAACSMNTIPGLDENVQQKWAQVESQYQRRADLIPSLVATVEGAANAETKLVVEAVKARAEGMKSQVNIDFKDPGQMEAFARNQNALTTALANMKMVVERYPNFKANANFMGLQTQLEGTENRIQVARRDYTVAVSNFNTYIRTFPGIVGNMVVGVKPAQQYKADASAANAPKVSFGGEKK